MSDEKTWRVELTGRDEIEVRGEAGDRKVRFVGCEALIRLMHSFRNSHGDDPATWPLPTGHAHHELLLKELILKIKGQWNHPYPHDEVCHCRTVSLKRVEEAILAGAHTPEAVSRWTSASTSCGTCRPDVIRLIEFRLETK